MVTTHTGMSTQGSLRFDPDIFFSNWKSPPSPMLDNNLEKLIKTAFGLPVDDNYVYHAIASVTLAQVQRAIFLGGTNGLHAWYLDSEGKQMPPPPQADIMAYTSIFSPTTSTTKALTALSANAKKGSRRAAVADNLNSNRVFPPSLIIPRSKSHINPYLDLWTWSCHNLEWSGPDASTVNVKQSHHILPIFYHHFGCVCPTLEALETIRCLANGRTVFDIGSGNGYWTYMMRRHGLTVAAVDNGDSLWRTIWIVDTSRTDGAKFLARHNGGKDAVLLLVYPQVSGDFTKSVLDKYQGDTICVAGTQNKNGFTAFGDTTIDSFVDNQMPEWIKIVQTPLPSFAAKDEALFIFQRRPK